jgi:hypothetical protein
MDWLGAFVLLVGAGILIWCTFWSRSPFVALTVVALCVLASIHRFVQGAWVLGIVEAVWAVIAIRRWLRLADGAPTKS